MNDIINKVIEPQTKKDTAFDTSGSKTALAIVAISAASIDAEITSEERMKFIALALGSPLFSDDIDLIIEEASEIIEYVNKTGANEAMIRAGEALSDTLKEKAFAWAVEIVTADGIMDPEEKDFLETMIQAFHLNQETAKKIIDVINIKNRTL